MNKVLVFDMDGTIADLYGVKNWLPMLRAEHTTPYKVCGSLVDMEMVADILNELKADGYKVVVTTWTAKGGSRKYNKAVAEVKKDWLDDFNFPYDEFHAVKYGTTKLNCTRKLGGFQILFDDSEQVRKGWNGGEVVDPTKTDIVEYLVGLLNK